MKARGRLAHSNLTAHQIEGPPARGGTLKRFGWIGVLLVVVLVAAGCGSGKKVGGDLGGTTTVPANTPTTSDKCATTQLAVDRGRRQPDDDHGHGDGRHGLAIRPGLFKGSGDGVKAWGDYINSNGGLACRKVVVKTADSKLRPTTRRTRITAACGELARDGRHDRAVPRQHEAGRAVQGQGRQGDGHPRHRRAADRAVAAVLADLVRDAADRLGVPVQRHRRARRSRSATRSTTTTSTSTARTRCTACSWSRRTSRRRSRRRCRSSGPRRRWASRATPSSARAALDPDRLHAVRRRRMKSQQVDVRPQRLSTTRAPCFMRKEAQVQGVEHREGLGLLGAVLRQAPHPRGRQRGRGPVRVAELPAVRGQGLQRRARRLPQVRQEARRLRRPGVHRR